MPGGRIRIPLLDASNLDVADLAALGQAVLSDLCVLAVVPVEKGSDSPLVLDIQFRGTHVSLDHIQTMFPRGIAARSALSSKRFDVNKVKRVSQELQLQWRSSPDSWLSASSASITQSGMDVQSTSVDHGWDDVSIKDLGFELLSSSATPDDVMREVWIRIQPHLERYLRLPTIFATLPILDPGRLDTVATEVPPGRPCPLLLGLDGNTSLPTTPAQGGWIKCSDPQAIMRSLVYRFSFSRPAKTRPDFLHQLVTDCLGVVGAADKDGDRTSPSFNASRSLWIGWASRGGKIMFHHSHSVS